MQGKKLRLLTKPFRHWIVRHLTPKIYNTAFQWEKQSNSAVPRPMTTFMHEHSNGDSLIGAEIGIAGAKNSENIMQMLNMKKLYMIDPYGSYLDGDGKVHDRSSEEEGAKQRMTPYDGQIEYIRKTSDLALTDITDPLDFIYIDGNHSHKWVQHDINSYYPKVKPGGVIGGHDFEGEYLGLCLAVLEFSDRNRLKLHTKKSDWWVVK